LVNLVSPPMTPGSWASKGVTGLYFSSVLLRSITCHCMVR